jgi:hypothetical protein
MLQAVRAVAKDEAGRAASGVVSDAENAALAAVDAHAAQKQYVHGVGPLYVAKTRNSSQYVDWSEIQGKPDLSELGVDESTIEIDASQVVTGTVNINRLPVADAGEVTAFELVRANDPRLQTRSITLEAGVPLTDGMFVTSYNDGGVSKCKPANASSPDTAAIGFIRAGYGIGQMAEVYPFGRNSSTYLPGATSGAMMQRLYLSTTDGYATLNMPTGAGNILQMLGFVIEIASGTVVHSIIAQRGFFEIQ